jgi:hypothetical protein
MPPGAGKKSLHIAVDAADKTYLEAQAALRHTSVTAIVLDSIARFVDPEKEQRSALRDQMTALAHTLATLTPELQRLEQTAVSSEVLGRELIQLRTDVRQSLQGVAQRLEVLVGSRRQQQLRRWMLGGALLLGSIGMFYGYPTVPLLDGLFAVMGLLIIVLP